LYFTLFTSEVELQPAVGQETGNLFLCPPFSLLLWFFRGHQEQIINATLSGRDVFVLMPTGGGKVGIWCAVICQDKGSVVLRDIVKIGTIQKFVKIKGSVSKHACLVRLCTWVSKREKKYRLLVRVFCTNTVRFNPGRETWLRG